MYVIHVRAMMSPDPAQHQKSEEICDKQWSTNRTWTGSGPEAVQKRSKGNPGFENLNTLKLIELLEMIESMDTFELSAILELMLSAIWNSQHFFFNSEQLNKSVSGDYHSPKNQNYCA